MRSLRLVNSHALASPTSCLTQNKLCVSTTPLRSVRYHKICFISHFNTKPKVTTSVVSREMINNLCKLVTFFPNENNGEREGVNRI